MPELFKLITPITYWILISLWSFILYFYLKKMSDSRTKQLFHTLVIILAIDAFRTLFESVYFGLWYTSLSGMIPFQIGDFLTRPELVIIPKIINVIAAIIIIVLLLKKWLPREELEQDMLGTALYERDEESRALFENNPVSCWLEDFTEVQTHFEVLREEAVSDIDAYFNKYPEKLGEISQAIKIKDVNQATLDLHKAQNKEQLFQGLKKTFTPESFEVLRKGLIDLWNGKIQSSHDGIVRTLDGELRYVQINYRVLPGYERTLEKVLVSLVDNTPRWLAEKELSVSEKKYRNLFEHMVQGVFYINADGVLIDYNNAALEIFGLTSDQFMGKTLSDPQWKVVSEDGIELPGEKHPAMVALQTGKEVRDTVVGVYNPSKKHFKWLVVNAIPQFNKAGETPYQVFVTLQDITELKNAEREAIILQTTIDQAPVGVALADEQINIYYCNPKGLGTRGGATEDLVKIPKDAFTNWQVLKLNGEPYEVDDLPLVRAITKGESIREEFIVRHQDGSDHICDASANPIYENGIIIGGMLIFLDVSERKQAEEALLESEERLHHVFTNSPFPIMVHAEDGRTIMINKTWTELTGYLHADIPTIAEWTEKAYGEKKEDVSNNTIKPLYTIEERVDEGEFSIRTKDDRTIVWDFSSAPIGELPNGQKLVVSMAKDVTEQKIAAQEKQKMEMKLNHVQKMQSIGNLAGGIAHDFNNILTSIIGFTELALGDAAKGSPQEDNLEEVCIAGNRAKDLVKQILAFAHRSDEVVKPIRLSDIIDETLKLLRPSPPTTIEIMSSIESGSLAMGNSSQLSQVVLNLCTNAIHAMQNQGGILEISLKDTVATEGHKLKGLKLDPGDYIEFKVSDNGPGIDPMIIENIYEPYYTTKDVGEGTGMGLAMVKGIVESYGGNIVVQSKLNEGTVFTVLLPISKSRDKNTSPQTATLALGTEHILFVDDEPPITRMGSRILKSLGYTVTIRTSSSEALELFKEKHDEFDLIISDMTMPSMTGDILAVEMRKIRQDIPIILCTGYSNKMNEDKAKAVGIDSFVHKPFTKMDFANTIREVLDAK